MPRSHALRGIGDAASFLGAYDCGADGGGRMRWTNCSDDALNAYPIDTLHQGYARGTKSDFDQGVIIRGKLEDATYYRSTAQDAIWI